MRYRDSVVGRPRFCAVVMQSVLLAQRQHERSTGDTIWAADSTFATAWRSLCHTDTKYSQRDCPLAMIFGRAPATPGFQNEKIG